MKEKRTGFSMDKAEWFAAIAIVVLVVFMGLYLVVSTPEWWRWCLVALDVRIWPDWKRYGIVGSLVAILLLIRYWPEKKDRQTA